MTSLNRSLNRLRPQKPVQTGLGLDLAKYGQKTGLDRTFKHYILVIWHSMIPFKWFKVKHMQLDRISFHILYPGDLYIQGSSSSLWYKVNKEHPLWNDESFGWVSTLCIISTWWLNIPNGLKIQMVVLTRIAMQSNGPQHK
ncbi:hypothetical protein BJ912DRAFT_1044545 [Pholiota molesta]|nr:hypothetical protein BJ912DRAFT_1044545 [Pholiota molesta]